MPLIIGWITTLVTSSVVRAVVVRIAVALGISALTYGGIAVSFSLIWDHVNTSLGGVGTSAAAFLALCKVPNALDVIASAYTSALALKGLTGSGLLKKISWGGAGSVIGGS